MRRRHLAPLALAAGLLAACSATEWVNTAVSDDQTVIDRQDCRAIARAEAERVDRRQPAPREDGIIGSGYDQMMAGHDFRRMTDRIFSRCMEGRGYRRASRPIF